MNIGDKVFWVDETEFDRPLRGCDTQLPRKLFFIVSGEVVGDDRGPAPYRSPSRYGVYVKVGEGDSRTLLIDKNSLFATKAAAMKEYRRVFDAHVLNVRQRLLQSKVQQLAFENDVAKYLLDLERVDKEKT